MSYTRRDIGRLALTGLPVRLAGPWAPDVADAALGSELRLGRAQVGLLVPATLGSPTLDASEIVRHCVGLGVSAVELGGQAIEAFLGAPERPASSMPAMEDGFELGLHALEEEVLQDERELADRTFAERMGQWRGTISLAPLDACRRGFEGAGVRIEIVNWPDLAAVSSAEVDYCFRAAAALGARAVSTGLVPGAPRRLGPFAERHQTWIGFHGREDIAASDFEEAFSHGRFNAATLDVSRWTAAGHGSLSPFLAEHSQRITHVYVNDLPSQRLVDQPSVWTDPPARAVLEGMRDRRWPFQATVAFDDVPPADPAWLAQIARALQYCRSFVER